MVRKKQINNENGAVLNRDFPRRDRSLIMVSEELRRLYPNAKPEHIEMALPRSSPLLRLGAPRTGVPMKQIQEWLGHSDRSTTANIYSHLDAVTKADTGAAMSKALG